MPREVDWDQELLVPEGIYLEGGTGPGWVNSVCRRRVFTPHKHGVKQGVKNANSMGWVRWLPGGGVSQEIGHLLDGRCGDFYHDIVDFCIVHEGAQGPVGDWGVKYHSSNSVLMARSYHVVYTKVVA